MNGFLAAECGHVMQLYNPQSVGAAATSDTFCMENWAHATIIISLGAGSGCAVTLGQCTSFAGSGRATISDFRYAMEATDAGDTLDAALAVASSITIAAGTGGFAVIELDAAQLSDGYPYVQVNVSDPGTAKIVGVLAILSGGRYQEDITATAIA